MTTLRQPRPAGFPGLTRRRDDAGAARRHASARPLRLVAIGEALAGDVSLVAGSRGTVTELTYGQTERPLRDALAASAAIVRADLVLVAEDARGPAVWLARRLRRGHARKVIPAREGAHTAALSAYYDKIADALIEVDRDGVFSYADRARLAAAGHAHLAR
ncbi:PAS domain-containing protein [Amorphus suaedae]